MIDKADEGEPTARGSCECGPAEARCGCGRQCCAKHWISRGAIVPATQHGMCLDCDYEAYKNSYPG